MSGTLNIAVVGGGPAGLYFALLTKRDHPRHRVTVFERNPANSTFGFGVVFSRRTLEVFRQTDRLSYEAILQGAETWDSVDVVHRDERIAVHGNAFAGIERIHLLHVLQERCRALGVELHFERPIESLEELSDADLVLAADGVGSRLRDQHPDSFGTRIDARSNHYIWLGTRHRFEGLTLTFRTVQEGLFIAHSYRFSPSMSTFIVECDRDTFLRAGLEGRPVEDSLRFLERVFERDLGGEPLDSNLSRWIQFLIVKNERWYHGRVALAGDAAHTAHFSIGSGTKLAMEDSIALWQALTDVEDPEKALPLYQERRRPQVEEFQAAAFTSLRWFETAHTRMHLAPIEIAWDLMTRSGRVDLESLRRRDPAFIEAHDRFRARRKA